MASTVLNVILRTVQLLFCTDSRGFIISEKKEECFFLLLVCALLTSVAVGAGLFIRRCPEKPPKSNAFLSGASLVFGGWILIEAFTAVSPSSVPLWQPLLMNIFGAFSSLLLIAYAAAPLLKKEIPGILFILPVLYMMMRMIWIYTALNTLALTVEHIFLLLACGATLIFMHQLAKLFCGLGGENHFKHIMIAGICAVIFDADYAIPNIIAEIKGAQPLSGESVASELLILLSALFILCFLLCYFSKRNLKARHSHRHIESFSIGETDFYIGDSK